MVSWFGQGEDFAALLVEKTIGQLVPKPFQVIFEGQDETFVKDYAERPAAETVLADILNWQLWG